MAQAWPKHSRTRGVAGDHPNLGSVIGANDRLLHPPLTVAANQGRLRRRGGDDNLLIRGQNQGVRPTVMIRRKPLCPLSFRLSPVRTVCERFASSRGPNADQTSLPGLKGRFVEATHPVLMTDVYSRSTYPRSPRSPTDTTDSSIAALRSWRRSSRPPSTPTGTALPRYRVTRSIAPHFDGLHTSPSCSEVLWLLFSRGPNADQAAESWTGHNTGYGRASTLPCCRWRRSYFASVRPTAEGWNISSTVSSRSNSPCSNEYWSRTSSVVRFCSTPYGQ